MSVLLLAFALMATLGVDQARACGFTTHNLIANRTRALFRDATGINAESLINRHVDALQGGAPFPDYLYTCGSDHDAPDRVRTHTDACRPPFQAAAAQYIVDKYPQPWDADTEKLVVFMLGVVSHYIADINWHGLSQIPFAQGFLRTLGEQNYNCTGDLCEVAHSEGDTAGEFVAAFSQDLSFYEPFEWYVPTQDLIEIFHYVPSRVNKTVNASAINSCSELFAVASWAIKEFGSLIYPVEVGPAPFLSEQYLDFYLGGIDDNAVWSSFMWNRMLTWVEHGPPNGTLPQSSLDDATRERVRPPKAFQNVLAALKPVIPHMKADNALQIVDTKRGRELKIDTSAAGMETRTLALASLLSALGKHLPLEQARAMLASSSSTSDATPPRGEDATALHAVVVASTEPNGYAGAALCVGDLNHDGEDDLVYGSYGVSRPGVPQHGQATVRLSDASGSPTEVTLRSPSAEYARFGYACAIADMNMDGVPDLVVSAPSHQGGQNGESYGNYTGFVAIYFGPISTNASAPSAIIYGEDKFETLGHVLTSFDACGTQTSYLVVSSPYWGVQDDRAQTGIVYIIAARSTWSSASSVSSVVSQRLVGESAFSWFGASVSHICGQQHEMLMIGAPGLRQDGLGTVGGVYTYALNMSSLPYASIVSRVTGTQDRGKFGWALSTQLCGAEQDVCVAISTPSYGQKLIASSAHDMEGRLDIFPLASLMSNSSVNLLTPRWTFTGQEDYAHFGWRHVFVNSSAIAVASPQAEYERGGVTIVSLQDSTSTPIPPPADTNSRKARFGASLALLQSNGSVQLAVAAPLSHVGAPQGGAIYIHTLD